MGYDSKKVVSYFHDQEVGNFHYGWFLQIWLFDYF